MWRSLRLCLSFSFSRESFKVCQGQSIISSQRSQQQISGKVNNTLLYFTPFHAILLCSLPCYSTLNYSHYSIILCHIISYHIILHHHISHQVIHIISYNITSCLIRFWLTFWSSSNLILIASAACLEHILISKTESGLPLWR